jgi:hypothetical protein
MNALQRRGIARGSNPGIGRFVSDLNDNRRKVYPLLFPCDLSLPETERASIAGLVRAYSDDESKTVDLCHDHHERSKAAGEQRSVFVNRWRACLSELP